MWDWNIVTINVQATSGIVSEIFSAFFQWLDVFLISWERFEDMETFCNSDRTTFFQDFFLAQGKIRTFKLFSAVSKVQDVILIFVTDQLSSGFGHCFGDLLSIFSVVRYCSDKFRTLWWYGELVQLRSQNFFQRFFLAQGKTSTSTVGHFQV